MWKKLEVRNQNSLPVEILFVNFYSKPMGDLSNQRMGYALVKLLSVHAWQRLLGTEPTSMLGYYQTVSLLGLYGSQ